MVKYLIMDIDGTLTDGKIYMSPGGEAMKAFSVKDGYVINFILKPAGIVPIVITARKSQIVQNRCDELGIKEVYQGKLDKITMLKEIVGEENLGQCAYFGDDILDLECMYPINEAGGIAGCPADAIKEVKAAAGYVCVNKAGDGALREFAEWLITPKIDEYKVKKRVEAAVEYLLNLEVTEKDVGKRNIVDENFFYFVQSYMTKPDTGCKLESHRIYADIQVVVSGNEIIDLADISRLSVKEEYNIENDVIFWNIPQRMAHITMGAGGHIILYPENAHRGGVCIKESERVLKIVGKVKIN